MPRFVIWTFLVNAIVLCTGVVSGQNYPNKPIRIVTGGVGGGADFTARLIAPSLTATLGQPIVIDNRPTGVIPGDTVAKATPDGYTLLVGSSSIWLSQFLQKVPYDTLRDFAPVTLAVSAPNVLVVTPSLPAKSVQELIAVAKAKPGELNYASGASGSSNHLAGELFKARAGVSIVRVPYKGIGLGLNDLIGGQVQLMFPNASSALVHVKSGRLRALAVTSAKLSALAPGLPTVAASGLPGFESTSPYVVLAPAKTLVTLVDRLSQEIVRIVNAQDVKQKFFDAGLEVIGNTPAEFLAAIKFEMTTMGKVIKDAGIHEE